MNNEYKISEQISPLKIAQLNYTDQAKSLKITDVLCIPNSIIADANASAQKVGKGNLLRVEGSAAGYIWFASTAAAATVPDVASTTALKTPNGFFFIVATEDYVRTSAAMRIEVILE